MLIPIILSGGSGTRLWPVSRQQMPKPFMKILDNKTLLAHTLERAIALDKVTDVITLTNKDYYHHTLSEYNKYPTNIQHHYLLEPCKRNTAPSIATAAYFVNQKFGKDAVMLVMPADHIINTQEQFNQVISQAYALAQDDKLVTIGIKPDHATSEYGYIQLGASLPNNSFSYNVEKFVEKPSIEKATRYIATGNYLFNAGIFCFKASSFIQAVTEHQANIASIATSITQDISTANKIILDADKYATMPDISIDYAIMEHAHNIACVAAAFSWSDLGNWDAIAKLNDEQAAADNVISIDSKNNYIHGKTRRIATIGLKDTLVIDTPDALLIADKNNSAKVKELVKHLADKECNTLADHIKVYRPWGTYTVLEESKHFKVKRIEVYPQQYLSLQMHHHRSEHWVVVTGTAQVINDNQELTLHANESTYIPAGHKHRLSNLTDDKLEIIEVQTGSYVGEDDIVRFEDVYGR
jgi:mannose-1-phosphate guanylyltransferase / mannose-6-phosphate isomerase